MSEKSVHEKCIGKFGIENYVIIGKGSIGKIGIGEDRKGKNKLDK